MDENENRDLCADLRKKVSDIVVDGEKSVRVSCGYVYGLVEQAGDVRMMLKQADMLMYQVKKTGKDNIRGAPFTRA